MHALLICVRRCAWLCAWLRAWLWELAPRRRRKSSTTRGAARALRLPTRQHLPVVGRRASRSFFNAGFCRQQNERYVFRGPHTAVPARGEGALCSLFALRLKAPKQIGNEAKGKAAKRKRAQVTAKPDACNTAAEPCYVYCAWSLRRVKPPASRSAKPAHGQLP